MKKIGLILFTFYAALFYAQNNLIPDSLKSKLKFYSVQPQNRSNDSNIIIAALEISKAIIENLPDSSVVYSKIALKLSEKINNKFLVAKSLLQQGYAAYNKGKLNESVDIYLKAIETIKDKSIHTTKEVEKLNARCFNNLGITYWNMGKYPEALEAFFSSLKINEALKNKEGITNTFGNLGLVYSSQKKFDKALEYNHKALKIAKETNNKESEAVQLGNIGLLFFEYSKCDSALVYLNDALKRNKEMGDEYAMAYNLVNIAATIDYQGTEAKLANKLDESEKLFTKALSIFKEAGIVSKKVGNANLICIIEANLGRVYMNLKKYQDAEIKLKEAMVLAKENANIELEKEVCENLYDLYEKTRRYKEALEYHKNLVVFNDSLTKKENVVKQTELEMQYEFDKKSADDQLRRQRSEIIKSEEQRKQQLILIFVSSILGLAIIFAFYFFRNMRRSNKQKNLIALQKTEVERQKHLVEEKQKEVMDSIQYAQRIQRAHLPNEKIIAKNLARLKKQ